MLADESPLWLVVGQPFSLVVVGVEVEEADDVRAEVLEEEEMGVEVEGWGVCRQHDRYLESVEGPVGCPIGIGLGVLNMIGAIIDNKSIILLKINQAAP